MATALGSFAGISDRSLSARHAAGRAFPRILAAARRCAEIGLFAVVMLLLVRTWFVEGLIAPARVAGPSMAATLKGPHWRVHCSDCGFAFAFGADQLRADRSAVCPNCRFTIPDVGPLQIRKGDRLLIDKLAFALSPPRRWETVVFRCPRQASQYCIKRLVGLPGETVQIVAGEVLVNGQPLSKSLRQFRQLAILVHDTRFRHRPSHQRPQPWQSKVDGGWRSTDDGFRYAQDTSAELPATMQAPEWLWFQYRSPSQAATRVPRPILVTDDYGYNQALSRSLNEVNDLLLVSRFKTSGTGALYLRGATADRAFVVRLQPEAGTGQLYVDGTLVDQLRGAEPFFRQPQQLELAMVDGTFRVAIDGRLILEYAPGLRDAGVDRGAPPAAPAGVLAGQDAGLDLWPLAIGAVGIDVTTANLQVYRDVYYTDVLSTAGGETAGLVTLGDDEYFVLGDNSPVSLDSRHAGQGLPVHRDLMIGRPLIRP